MMRIDNKAVKLSMVFPDNHTFNHFATSGLLPEIVEVYAVKESWNFLGRVEAQTG